MAEPPPSQPDAPAAGPRLPRPAYRRSSLEQLGVRPRLVILACAAAIPFAGLAVMRAAQRHHAAERAAEQAALDGARQIAGRVLERGRSVQWVLGGVSRFVRADTARIAANDRMLLAVKTSLSRFPVTNLWVFGTDGRLLGTSHRPLPKAALSIADRGYFQRALATRRPVFGAAHLGRPDNAWSVPVAQPVIDSTGALTAVVVGSIHLRELTSTLGEVSLPAGAEAVLVDGKGQLLAATRADTSRVGRPLATGSALALAARAADSAARAPRTPAGVGTVALAGADAEPVGTARTRLADGRELLAAGAAVPELGWRVYVTVDAATALEPTRRGLAEDLALGLAAVLAAAALAGVMARRLTRPIDGLVADAQALAAGDYARRTGEHHAPGELGTLSRAFDEMAAMIEARTADVQRSERRYRTLFESSPLPMFVADLTTFEFLAVNDACVAQYGWTRDEFRALSLLDVRPAEDRLKFLAVAHTLARALGPDDRVNAGVWRHQRKDGSLFEAEVFTGLTEHEGRPARLCVVMDVTARRTAERALLDSQEQLRRAQKMEAVGRFAGGIAHDFNNLLTGILVYCDLALADLRRARDEAGPAPDAARTHDDFAAIREAAQRAATLTAQILAFARGHTTQPVAVDPHEVLTGLGPMLQRVLGEDVRLALDLAPLSGVVLADRGQLEQVVTNLALNARDAMPDGGTLALALDELVVAPFCAEHPGVSPGRWVRLRVRDTGVGMDDETQARIFEPFFTTKARGHGTGLGLAMVYGIVQQAGGVVRVQSAPGAGSTFHVYLPHVDADAAPVAPADLPADHETLGGSETILLAEDEPLVRAVATEVLTRRGYAVLAAEDGPSAIAIARQHPGPIHLLVTDVVMPGMSGPQLAALVSGERAELRVLYTSGYADHEVLGRGVETGRMAFVAKPFTPEALLRAVRDAMEGGDGADGTAESGAVGRPAVAA